MFIKGYDAMLFHQIRSQLQLHINFTCLFEFKRVLDGLRQLIFELVLNIPQLKFEGLGLFVERPLKPNEFFKFYLFFPISNINYFGVVLMITSDDTGILQVLLKSPQVNIFCVVVLSDLVALKFESYLVVSLFVNIQILQFLE